MSASARPEPPDGLCLLGAGDHARVVAAAAALAGVRVLGCWGEARGGGLPVLGGDAELLAEVEAWRAASFHLAFVGAPGSTARRAAWERWASAGLEWATLVHPAAYVAADARIGRGVYVGPHAVVNPGAVLGDHAVVNSGVIVEHDVRVGTGAHLAPGTVVGGGAEIGAWSHVGLGSRVRDHVSVGEGAVVAMGAVVVGRVGAGERVMGVPARPTAAAVRLGTGTR